MLETKCTIIHKKSSSETYIECGIGEDNKPKVLYVEMISGNVIPLYGVRQAFEYLKEERKAKSEKCP